MDRLPTPLLESAIISSLDRREGSREVANLVLYDYLVCALSGSADLNDLEPDGAAGSATRMGRSGSVTLDNAVRFNAVAAHRLDSDDIHWGSVTHPGGIVWPVVLGLAEQEDLTVAAAITAAELGYDIVAWVGEALGEPNRRLWHPTALVGPIGAAAAGSYLMHGDAAAAANAASLAASVAGGLLEGLRNRSGEGLFHRWYGVSTALDAVRATEVGMKGSLDLLESSRGLIAAVTKTDRKLGPLAPEQAISATTLRLYPGAGITHGAIEATLALVTRGISNVKAIRIEASSLAIDLAGDIDPRTAADAWWSLPYIVACVLATGDTAAIVDPAGLEDAEIRRLLDMSSLSAGSLDAQSDLAASVTCSLSDGTEVTEFSATPRGHPDRAPDRSDLEAKALRLAPHLSADDARELRLSIGTEHTVRDLLGQWKAVSYR